MTLPDEFTINKNNSPLEGIINEIKKHYSDPISSNVIEPYSPYVTVPGMVIFQTVVTNQVDTFILGFPEDLFFQRITHLEALNQNVGVFSSNGKSMDITPEKKKIKRNGRCLEKT